MTFLTILLFIGFLVFFVYAVFTQWSKTAPDQSMPKRVLAAMVAAVGTLAAAIASWAQGWGS